MLIIMSIRFSGDAFGLHGSFRADMQAYGERKRLTGPDGYWPYCRRVTRMRGAMPNEESVILLMGKQGPVPGRIKMLIGRRACQ